MVYYAMPAFAAWEPKQPVELVVMAGKGGGADRMAQFMTSIIKSNLLSPQPFIVAHKPEGSGAEALLYLKHNAGNPHVIMVTLNSFYTTPLRQPKLEIDISAYAPIARMAEDTFVLWVHADAPIKTLEDFIKTAKDKGSDWIMAGTGQASEDHLLSHFLNSAYGLNMKYVSFRGGGRVANELVEKRANSTVNNPSEQEENYIAGLTRPLAAFTPKRLEMYEEVPTFREKGKDLVYFMQRSIVGPPGMSPEAVAFYRSVFRKVYESKAWQDYMNENSLRRRFLTGQELMDYWMKERNVHRNMLKRMGDID